MATPTLASLRKAATTQGPAGAPRQYAHATLTFLETGDLKLAAQRLGLSTAETWRQVKMGWPVVGKALTGLMNV